MKKLFNVLLVFLFCGCATIDKIKEIIDENKNDIVTEKKQISDIVDIEPGLDKPGISTGVGGLMSSIDIDGSLNPHCVIENGRDIYCGVLKDDKWELISFNTMDKYNNSQFANSNLEIDRDNDVLWSYGYGWFPHNADLNIYVIDNCTKNNTITEFKSLQIHRQNAGSASWDKHLEQFIVCSHYFEWVALEYDDGIKEVSRGNHGSSSGGEKEDFYISKSIDVKHPKSGDHAVWNFATDSKYQNSLRNENSKRDVIWSDWNTYYTMWDDMCYMGIRADNVEPGTAYLATYYWPVQWEKDGNTYKFRDRGIFINIWKTVDIATGEGYLVYPANKLLNIDTDGHMHKRYPVQLAEAKYGGCFIGYTKNKQVIVKWVPSDGDISKIKEFNLGSGGMSSIRVDKNGNLHLLYTGEENQLRYRKIYFYEESIIDKIKDQIQ